MRISGLQFSGGAFMQQAALVVGVFNDVSAQDLPKLPAYLTMIFAVSMIAARRSLTFIAKRYPDAQNLSIKEAALEQAELKMRSLGGLANKALYLSEEVTGRPNHFPNSDRERPAPVDDQAALPFEFDFSSLFEAGLPDGFWDQGVTGVTGWDWGNQGHVGGNGFVNGHVGM
jgi:hypothetical protein